MSCYHAALNTYKKLRKKRQLEVSPDYLRAFYFEPISEDEYFVKCDVPMAFTVRGERVIVECEQLAAALLCLLRKEIEALENEEQKA